MTSALDIPENFFDTASAVMLRQPEPQYPLATLYKSALNAAYLAGGESLGLPGRQIMSAGAPIRPTVSDRLDLNTNGRGEALSVLSQVFAGKVQFKGQPGHTVKFNRMTYGGGGFSLAERRIGRNQTISVVPVPFGLEQKPITLGRFGGPYDVANTRVAPFSLDKFDTQVGVFQQGMMVGDQLGRDWDKWLEVVWITLLNLGSQVARPLGMATDNAATSSAMYGLDYYTLNLAEKMADEANVPYFADGKRLALITPAQANSLKNDPMYARYSEYHPQYNALFPGYLKTVNNMHVVRSNTLDVAVNGSNIPIHKGMLLGPDCLGAGVGEGGPNNDRPVWTAVSTDDNFGEAPKAIWLTYGAYELFDNRLVIGIRTTAGV